MAERKELLQEEALETVSGGQLRSMWYEGEAEGTLTSSKVNKTFHYDPIHHQQIGEVIKTTGMSEVDKVNLMLSRKWIY